MDESYFFPQAEHSSSTTFDRFGIREKSNTDVLRSLFSTGWRAVRVELRVVVALLPSPPLKESRAVSRGLMQCQTLQERFICYFSATVC